MIDYALEQRPSRVVVLRVLLNWSQVPEAPREVQVLRALDPLAQRDDALGLELRFLVPARASRGIWLCAAAHMDPLDELADRVFERAARHGRAEDDQTLLLLRNDERDGVIAPR
jgi:hypothetical protein